MSGNSNRVRKNSTNSIGSTVGTAVRPRANTISHIDGGALGMLSAANRSVGSLVGMDPPLSASGSAPFMPRGMSASSRMHGNISALPRLATQGHPMDISEGLRTAPPGHLMHGFGFDQSFAFTQAANNSTINPAQLHMGDSVGMMQSPVGGQQSPFTPQPVIMEDEGDIDWMHGFNTHMSFAGPSAQHMPEHAINDSPHQLQGSGTMPGFVGEMQYEPAPSNPSMMWSQSQQFNGSQNEAIPMSSGQPVSSGFDALTQTISPETLHSQVMPETIYENSALPFSSPPNLSSLSSHTNPHPAFSSDGTDGSSATGSQGRQSSVTSTSVDSITDTTRNALLLSLSQPSGIGGCKYSQPGVSSPLSPPGPTLPTTGDLQRYVCAYIQYFYPHMPFIHVPTLSFDAPAFNSNIQSPNGAPGNFSYGGIMGGGGCLILSMAAIGACHEFEREASKELFEAAKRMIHIYLDERKRAEAHPANKQSQDPASPNTPLWLVQAMLLNIVSGHQSEDKVPQNIASTHCTALVNLAKSAHITEALSESAPSDMNMAEAPVFHDSWANGNQPADESAQWYRWINAEERKRTLFAIFHLSSLLVVAWNHAPALMNSEIHVELPCDEILWKAPSPRAWATRKRELGGTTGSMSFPAALSELLMANQKQKQFKPLSHGQPFGTGMPCEEIPLSSMRPSTYGCLVLIDALHNYIWETRQRHTGRQWTTQETEAMHAAIEPALRAWQAAWQSNPEHRIERPNPFGHGPLSADSIPLLDLAYVRLFVNLGTSKEAMWQRDFQGMSDEIARGSDFIQHADHSGESPTAGANTAIHSPTSEMSAGDPKAPSMAASEGLNNTDFNQDPQSRKRERHLRKAASYAADSLIFSDKYNITFADFSARELPAQSALCMYDCAQVLAEWVATVQERVGHYIGILGRDPINFSDVPAIMLLDEEDVKLLSRVEEFLQRTEDKMSREMSSGTRSEASMAQVVEKLPGNSSEGYASKILKVTTFILDRSLVWPGKH